MTSTKKTINIKKSVKNLSHMITKINNNNVSKLVWSIELLNYFQLVCDLIETNCISKTDLDVYTTYIKPHFIQLINEKEYIDDNEFVNNICGRTEFFYKKFRLLKGLEGIMSNKMIRTICNSVDILTNDHYLISNDDDIRLLYFKFVKVFLVYYNHVLNLSTNDQTLMLDNFNDLISKRNLSFGIHDNIVNFFTQIKTNIIQKNDKFIMDMITRVEIK